MEPGKERGFSRTIGFACLSIEASPKLCYFTGYGRNMKQSLKVRPRIRPSGREDCIVEPREHKFVSSLVGWFEIWQIAF